MTSLDDLFEPDEPPTRSARPRLVWAAKATLAAMGLGTAAAVVLFVLGIRLWYPILPAGILAALVLHRLTPSPSPPLPPAPRAYASAPDKAVATLGPAPAHALADDREPDSGAEGAGAPDGLAPAVDRWHARLRAGRWRPGRSLRPSLAELIDQRLRQRHGCTRDSDPNRARALLGERLWSFLADPGARTPSPRELAAMLTTVEEL